MRVKPIIIISLLLIFIFAGTLSAVSAENGDNVWYGYDLEILNTYDVQLLGQNSNIEIHEDKLIFNGEYIIKNKADKTQEAILGLPSNSLENVQVLDKGNVLRYYSRNGNYIEDKYPSDSLPKAEKWHTVSLWLKNGETKIINIRYEAKLTNDSKGVFSIRFKRNKSLINSDASMVVMTLNEFLPYDVLDTIGVAAEKTLLCGNKRFTLEMGKSSDIFGLDYELIDSLSVDRLNFSTDKKLKNIADSYMKKDYDSVHLLCNEYIKKPGDIAFGTVQINYIDAEAYRRQADFGKYVEIIKDINFDKLYPSRLKYKILYDLDQILAGSTQDSQLLDIIKSIQYQAYEDNEYIGKWMQDKGRNYIDIVKDVDPVNINTDNVKKESIITKTITFLKLENLINKISGFKYLQIIVIIIVFMLGFFVGRRKRKRRDKYSYYNYNR